jgi:cell pole-organizing protein PopZ
MSSANPKVQEPSMEEILASIRRIIADDQDSGRAAPPPIRSVPPPEPEDVLDLAELRPPPPSAPGLDLDYEDVSFREADNQVDFDAVPVDDGPEQPEAFEPPPPIRPAPAAAPAPASEPLLSNVANATVAGAFQKLSTTVLTSNPRTLEDLVQDMLRPMLKGWLDENLPPLVERLVRQEIERITRAGR